MSDTNSSTPKTPICPERRNFLKVATAMTAAVGGGFAGVLSAQSPGARRVPDGSQDSQDPVAASTARPNQVPSALSFQAGPGGTGVALDGDKDHATSPIQIEPWSGDVPTGEDLAFQPVHRLAALVQSRKVSPVELTELFLKRLEQFNPKLMFVVNFLKESARKEAKVAEAEIQSGKYRGPLHGIPYGIKDLFSAKGAPTTWGTKPFEDRVIDSDAAVVQRLRAAGAILMAKLATGVLAQGDQWFRGRTKNPWNPQQGSSGSSAGPGSATASGCVPFAIGTETLGSIVSPSRRCGISALRPTFGRISRAGCMALSHSMDKAGPMTRNALDAALVFAAIHGSEPGDPATLTAGFHFDPALDLAKLRIGYDTRADQDLLDVLRKLGANPKQIGSRPSTGGSRGGRRGGRRGAFGGAGGARPAPRLGMRSILSIESACAFDDFLAAKLDEKMVQKRRVRGWREARKISAVDYLNLQKQRFELMQKMAEFMDDWDLYVSSSGDLTLTNLTGHPSVVMPYTFQRGQPQCTMLVGKLFGDDQLLSVAHAYQQATDWHTRRPALG